MSVITEPNEVKSWYISNFEALEENLNGNLDRSFHKMRKSAISRFNELGFPGRKDEEWKYTPVSPLLKHRFSFTPPQSAVSPGVVRELAFQALTRNLVVIVNGHYSPELSNFDAPEGVVVESLSKMLKSRSALVAQHLGKYADFNTETFTALNTAFTHDGLFMFIPDNVVLDAPIHLLYLSDAREGEVYLNPRNLFVAGTNARAKIVEKYAALHPDAVYFNNGVTEVVLNEGARIDHLRVQDESLHSFHVQNLQAHLVRHSNYTLVNIDMGGRWVRNNFGLKFADEFCEGHLIGAYMATGRQHVDNHTTMDHAKPNCNSNEVFKGILGGKAKGVFNGKIYVRPDAQKTNSYQDNKALLISEDAVVNTKPQLEIFADDVKCSHGATVGQLDEEALFYLRSRGIPAEAAYSMLQYAFLSEALEYVSVEEVREELDQLLMSHFQQL